MVTSRTGLADQLTAGRCGANAVPPTAMAGAFTPSIAPLGPLCLLFLQHCTPVDRSYSTAPLWTVVLAALHYSGLASRGNQCGEG